MKSTRRNFLKLTGLTGIGLAGANVLKAFGSKSEMSANPVNASLPGATRPQKFNMSGYAAPKLDKVRIGFIGLGNRGPGHVSSMSLLEGVDIRALCDIVPANVDKTMKRIANTGFKPELYSGDAEAWKRMCDRNDIDLVYICTPWDMHAPMAVYAMEHGKHVAIEVPAASNPG